MVGSTSSCSTSPCTLDRFTANHAGTTNGYFDWEKIAQYDERKCESLLVNPGIVRNRLKVFGTVANAKAFIKVRAEFGTFSKYFWGFTGGKTIRNHFKTMKDVPPVTELATAISKDLKKRGFTFVGPTIIYAYMQAVRMVNDHLTTCFRYNQS